MCVCGTIQTAVVVSLTWGYAFSDTAQGTAARIDNRQSLRLKVDLSFLRYLAKGPLNGSILERSLMPSRPTMSASILLVILAASTLPLLAVDFYIVQAHRHQTQNEKARELVALADHAKALIEAATLRMQDTVHIIASHADLFTGLQSLDRQRQSSLKTLHLVMHAAAASLDENDRIFLFDDNAAPLAAYVGHSGRLSEDPNALNAAVAAVVAQPSHNIQFDSVRIDNRLAIVGHHAVRQGDQVIGHIAIVFDTSFLREIFNADGGLGQTGEWLFAIRGPDNEAVFAMPLKYDPDAAFVRTVQPDRLDVPITQALLNHETVMPNAPDYREKRVMAVTRYLQELDLGLVAKIDVDEVLLPARQARQRLLIIAAAAVALAIIGSATLRRVTAGQQNVAGMSQPPIPGSALFSKPHLSRH